MHGQTGGLVSRPSTVAGYSYEDVSDAYAKAVHSVLIGERGASVAAASLEKQLVARTGFRVGAPKTDK
jgi:hypothetical protein